MGGSFVECSPTQSDIEAALDCMSTPSRSPSCERNPAAAWHEHATYQRVQSPSALEPMYGVACGGRRRSLAAARDEFKLSVGAPDRSSAFRLAQLRKLDALSSSPTGCGDESAESRLGCQLGLLSP